MCGFPQAVPGIQGARQYVKTVDHSWGIRPWERNSGQDEEGPPMSIPTLSSLTASCRLNYHSSLGSPVPELAALPSCLPLVFHLASTCQGCSCVRQWLHGHLPIPRMTQATIRRKETIEG